MWAARICFIAAATLGLSACTGGGDNPPPRPTYHASLVPEATTLVPSSPKPAPVPVPPSSVKTPAPQVAAPVVRTAAPVAQAPAPAAPHAESLTLDLKALKQQLKETKSIGVFSKLSLKNKVDDLLDHFRKYYQGKGKMDMAELRESYNLLMMKVLSLLQDADQTLSAAIVSSREAIWDLLSDPKKFATLDI